MKYLLAVVLLTFAVNASVIRKRATDSGTQVHQQLQTVLGEIETAVKSGETVAHDLLAKSHTLIEQAKTIGGQVWHLVQEELGKLSAPTGNVLNTFLKDASSIWNEIKHLFGRRATETGTDIHKELQQVLGEIETAVKQGETVAHDLLQKSHTLLDQAKTIGGQVWHAAKEELAKISGPAGTVLNDFLKGFHTIWNEIKHLFGKRATDTQVHQELQTVLGEIDTAVKSGETVAHDLLAKSHTLIEQAKTIGGQVWHLVQEELGKLSAPTGNVLNTFLKDASSIWNEIKHLFGRRATEPGTDIHQELQQVLGEIETAVKQGETVAHDLLQKSHTLLDQAKTIGGQVWHAAKEELAKISGPAGTVLNDFLKGFHNIWNEIKHLFGKRATDTQVHQELQTVLGEIDTAVKSGETVAHDLLAKSHTLIEQAKTIGGQVWHLVKEELSKLSTPTGNVLNTFLKDASSIWNEIKHLFGRRATEPGTDIHQELQQVLGEIETAVKQGETVAHDLLQKSHTLLDQAKTIGGQVWHAAKEELAKISGPAGTVLNDFLKGFHNIWNEIKHLFGKRATDTQVHQELQTVLGEIDTAVKSGETVAHDLLAKSHTLIEQAKTIGGQVWHLVKEELSKLSTPTGNVLNTFLKDASSIWNEIKHLFGKRATDTQVHKELQTVLGEIDTAVKSGETVAHDLLAKSHTLIEQAKTIGGQVWHLVQEELSKLSVPTGNVLNTFLKDASTIWNEIKHLFGKRATDTQVHKELQTVLGEIDTAVKSGETVAHDLLAKSHTLIEQAKTIGGQVWHLVQEELSKLSVPTGNVLNTFLKDASTIWNEIKHLFGKRATDTQVHKELQTVLGEIEIAVKSGETVAHHLLAKSHTLIEQAKTIGGQVWHLVQEELSKLSAPTGNVLNTFLKDASSIWNEIKHLFGKRATDTQIHQELQTVLGEIDTAVKSGETVAHDLLAKSHTLIEQAKTIGGQVWHLVQGELSNLSSSTGNVLNTFLKDASSIWNEIKHLFGKRATDIHQELQQVLGEIETTVKQGETVAHDLLQKSHTLLDQAKTIGGQVWHAAKEELAKLSGPAGSVLNDFLKGFHTIWNEIKHLFGKRATDTQIHQELQTVLGEINTAVKSGETVAHDLLAKSHTLIEQAKTIGGQVWHLVQEELGKLSAPTGNVLNTFLKDASTIWNEIKHLFGKRAATRQVETELKQVLSEIETAVAQGKTVAHDLLQKGHTLLEQAKTIGGQVWHAAQGELAKLSDGASSVFSGFLKEVSTIWNEIKHLFGKRELEMKNRRFLLDTLKELSAHIGAELQTILQNVGSQFHAFNQYLVNLFHQQAEAAKPVIDNVKELAHNFLTATQQKSKEVVSEAKTFFEPFKHDLGELWGQIECTYNHIVHNSGTECHNPTY